MMARPEHAPSGEINEEGIILYLQVFSAISKAVDLKMTMLMS